MTDRMSKGLSSLHPSFMKGPLLSKCFYGLFLRLTCEIKPMDLLCLVRQLCIDLTLGKNLICFTDTV